MNRRTISVRLGLVTSLATAIANAGVDGQPAPPTIGAGAIETPQPQVEQANPAVLNNLAAARIAAGDWREAERLLRGALGAHPQLGTVHANLERLYTWRAAVAYHDALQAQGPVPAAPTLATLAPGIADTAQARPGTAAAHAAIRSALARWREAGRRGDYDGYFSAYAEGFTPPGGLSPTRWREIRTAALQRSAATATVEQAEVRVLYPGRAIVGLGRAQDDDVPGYRFLMLRNDGDAWRITHELTAR